MGQTSSSQDAEQRRTAMSAAAAVVEGALRANRVMVFSKSYCPYCTKARRARTARARAATARELRRRRPRAAAARRRLTKITHPHPTPQAKRALATVLPAAKFTVMEIESRPDCAEIQAYLAEKTGGSSVPRVFVDGEFIGGGDDTDALARSGELAKMAKAKGLLE
jgi:glutaredoxin 3